MALDNYIQLLGLAKLPTANWKEASLNLIAYSGRVVVEMAGVPEMSGGIVLPNGEGAEWRLRPDVGTVLAAGDGVELLPGETVVVQHHHGKWIEGFFAGNYVAQKQVRMYGCSIQTGGKVIRIPWWRSILATLKQEDGELSIHAKYKNVVIDRGDITEKTDSGIFLPDSATYRPTFGTVVSVGASVDPEIEVGMKVFYLANAMRPMRGFFGVGTDGLRVQKNYGIVPDDAILCQVVEAA